MKKALPAALAWLSIVVYALWVMWLDDRGLLPDPLATHWGPSGKADGFQGVGFHVMWSSIGLGIIAAILSAVVLGGKIHQSIRKLMTITLSGIFVFMLVLFSGGVVTQIGLSDAAGTSWPVWFWWLFIPLIGSLFFLLFAMPSIVIASDLVLKLRGLVMLRISFSDIEAVELIQARARDFGGLGLRYSRGRLAFIPSSGPAVLITTKSDGTILVRSNNAELAVATISAKI